MKAKQASQLLANRAEEIASYLLPKGKRSGSHWCVGSIEGEEGKSLKICIKGEKKGIWADFEGGLRGDLLDLWRLKRCISLSEAIKQSCLYLGTDYAVSTSFSPQIKREFDAPKRDGIRGLKEADEVFIYLNQERKLSKKCIEEFKICRDGKWVLFPYLRDGELIQMKRLHIQRRDGKKAIRVDRNCEPGLFGWQAYDKSVRSIVLTEGEIDAMSLWDYGYCALSIPFGGGDKGKQKWIEYEFDRLDVFDEIFLCFDDDQVGHITENAVGERLGLNRCRFVKLPYKDANECLKQGVSKEEIDRCFSLAAFRGPEELKSASIYLQAVIDRFYGDKKEEGVRFPWEKVRDRIVFRWYELSLWTGINGHGKSQFIGQVALESLKQGARVCIASLELKPEILLARLSRQAGGVDKPSQGYLGAIFQWYADKLWLFDLVGTAKNKRLLEVFLYAKQRFGINVFVIDSLLKCDLAEDDYNAQKKFVEALCDFKNEHKCHIHLIAHPRKGADETKQPGKLDIKGTGSISDLADNCFTIWRNKRKEVKLEQAHREGVKDCLELKKEFDAIWACDKQRNGEWEGKLALWFDRRSYQFLENHYSRASRYVEYSALEGDGDEK